MSVLETRGCSIRFGGVQAAQDVSISLGEWEIVGIIGPNGAGKTTTFNIITGFYTPNEGTVWFKGSDVTGFGVHERTAIGMGRTFQNVGLIKGSTVRENLVTAQHLEADYGIVAGMLGFPRTMRKEAELADRADQILELLDLADIADEQVAGLPYGVLKRLELAAVLATDPDVLLLDEPSSGMGPEEAHQLGDTLLQLRKEFGLSIMMIEHHVPLVVRVCDYVYCLSFGRLLAEGEPEEVRNHPEVLRAYLGEDPDEDEAPEKPKRKRPPIRRKKAPAKPSGTAKRKATTTGTKRTAAAKTPAKRRAAGSKEPTSAKTSGSGTRRATARRRSAARPTDGKNP